MSGKRFVPGDIRAALIQVGVALAIGAGQRFFGGGEGDRAKRQERRVPPMSIYIYGLV